MAASPASLQAHTDPLVSMTPALAPAPQASPRSTSSTYSFTTGIIIGQVSVFLLLFLVVRYVVFEDGKAGLKRRAERLKAQGRPRRPSHISRLSSAPPPPITSAQLLSKTGYDISSHPAETMDWLNVLFAQVISNYRSSLLAHRGEEGAREKVEEWLNPAQGVPWLDPIRVTALTLGSSYPLFYNARIRPSDATGRFRAETELEYSDSVTLAITTGLVINFPRPRFAVLPISLGVTLVGLHGTMTIELLSSPTSPASPTPHQSLRLSLHPDFDLSISTTSLLGSRAKLQDLPKIEQLVASRLRQALVDRVVWPCFWAVGLPGLGMGVANRAQKNRVGGNDDDDWDEDDAADGVAHDRTRSTAVDANVSDEGLRGRTFNNARSDDSEDANDGDDPLGRQLEMDFTGSFAGAAASTARPGPTLSRRSTGKRPVAMKTGLGGGVRTMPGGSNW